MCAHAGYVSGLTPPASADTVVGASSFSARNAMFAVWQAMSPIAPVPKSHHAAPVVRVVQPAAPG